MPRVTRIARGLAPVWTALFVLCLPAEGKRGSFPAEDRFEGRPWPAEVEGHVPVVPGEHPRLFFRRGDLPELRRRAETTEGRMIVQRLRVLLNGGDGETMTTVFSKEIESYPNGEMAHAVIDKPGVYTISHVAGYGFLYQLTGDKKYAEFGRQCFLKGFEEKVRDRDSRYALYDAGPLRVGPTLTWYALGYDLCYEGWDPGFRKYAAEKLLFHVAQEGRRRNVDVETLGRGEFFHPACNHWGGIVSGSAMIALATMGDPEADPAQVEKLLASGAQTTLRQLTEGIGDYGFFGGGTGPGLITTHTAFVPLLQAWRVAAGKNYLTPRPVGEWLTLKFVYGCTPQPKGAPPIYPVRGVYGHNYFHRMGMSGSGDFCQGFGAVSDRYKPALLWLYNRSFRTTDLHAEMPWDSINPYPHRSILALVNGPFGIEEANPGTVLPTVTVDRYWNLVQIRTSWGKPDDLFISVLTERSGGHYTCPPDTYILHRGRMSRLPITLRGAVQDCVETPNGWTIRTDSGSMAIDRSGVSGADLLIAWDGARSLLDGYGPDTKEKLPGPPGGARLQTVLLGLPGGSLNDGLTADDDLGLDGLGDLAEPGAAEPAPPAEPRTIHLLAYGSKAAARAEGENVILQGQTIHCDGDVLRFARH